jgi:hypothetical protein
LFSATLVMALMMAKNEQQVFRDFFGLEYGVMFKQQGK